MIGMETWRILPLSKIADILALLPPPAAEVNGQTVVFLDPNAAMRLHDIRDRLMAVLAAAKNVTSAEALEAMAAAHDAESSAQIGEPSAWRTDLQQQYRNEHGDAAMEEWKSERRAAMLCALKAVGLA